ncbi:MAG: M23 family metallopeptidase [Dehalococcoidia bacterium]
MRSLVLLVTILAALAASQASGSYPAASLQAQTSASTGATTPTPSSIRSAAAAPALPSSITRQLYAGWNFASWRIEGCEPIKDALESLIEQGIVNVATLFQAQSQGWRLFDPDAPDAINTLGQLCLGDIGVFHVSEDAQWVQRSSAASEPEYNGSLTVGAVVVVANTDGDCLNARTAPGGDINACLAEGFVGTIDDGPLYVDGYWWWHIEGQGWSVENYLRPFSEEAPPTTGPATSSGFIWPVSGNITDGFSAPRGNGYHEAIDIDVPDGSATPVAAAADGEVSVAETNAGYGYYVVIDHRNGFETLYAHLASIAVEVGQEVSQGEVIGYTGCTGYCTGEHLHFEIRKDGSPVDPLLYLP